MNNDSDTQVDSFPATMAGLARQKAAREREDKYIIYIYIYTMTGLARQKAAPREKTKRTVTGRDICVYDNNYDYY